MSDFSDLLDTWDALANGATAGPWEWSAYMGSARTLAHPIRGCHQANILKTTGDWPPFADDAAFIAAARTIVPQATAALRGATGQRGLAQRRARGPMPATTRGGPVTFTARFPGTCAAECGRRIITGDSVLFIDDELVHADCTPRDERPADVCGSCWLTKPCDCEGEA